MKKTFKPLFHICWYTICFSLVIYLTHTPFSFASRSRILVLGSADGGLLLDPHEQGSEGSFFLQDQYNLFYNPALLTKWNDWGIFEKSNGKNGAQAGIFKNFFLFSLGFFFNRQSTLSALTPTSVHPLEFFLASKIPFSWGLSFLYGRDSLQNQQNILRLGTYFETLSLSVFGAAALPWSQSQTGATLWKHRLFLMGARLQWGEWIPFLGFRYEKNTSSLQTKTRKVWGLGIGRNTYLTQSVRLMFSLNLWHKQETAKPSQWLSPLSIATEMDINSWLQIRGGFHLQHTPSTRLGASIRFEQAQIDWAIGNATGSEMLDQPTFSLSNGFFTALSLSYHW